MWIDPRAPDAMAHVEIMLDEYRSMEDIDAVVSHLPIPPDERAAVWLYAWSERDRRRMGRTILPEH